MNRELFRQVVGIARAFLGATVVLGLLIAVATIVQMSLLSETIGVVFIGGGDLGDVHALLLYLLGVLVVRAGLPWLKEMTAQRGALRINSQLREQLFAHILKPEPAYTRGERTGELTTTATEGVERLESYFSRYLPQMALSAFVPLLITTYIFPWDWSSAVVLLITMPMIPVLMTLVGS